MAGSVNKVILVGNLGRDPEVRSFPNGGKVVNLRVATSENWRDKQTGERKERTEWHSVAIYNENLARDRRAVSAQGLQGLSRGPARDPQVAGPVGTGPLLHRGHAARSAQMTLLDGRGEGGGAGTADYDQGRSGGPRRREPQPGRGAGRRDPVLGRASLASRGGAPASGGMKPPLGRRLAVGRLCGLPPAEAGFARWVEIFSPAVAGAPATAR